MTLTTVLIDISAISVLLLLAFLIRQKIPFFYKSYIPTSLIAGILGLDVYKRQAESFVNPWITAWITG